MFFVGFNGPPECGKDTLANLVADYMDKKGVTLPVYTMPLSFPLREIAFKMVGREYRAADYEAFKRERFPQFGHQTGRQLMIDVSESFLKPCYGSAIMAHLMCARLPDHDAVILIPDCGFQVEVDTIADLVGPHNLYVVGIRRTGTDFSNDSRQYVKHEFGSTIYNDGGLDDLAIEAGKVYSRLTNNMGWTL